MRIAATAVLFLALALAPGCGTIVGQGAATVMGAGGRYFEIKDVGQRGTLDRYQAVQVAAFDPAPMLGAIPQDIVTAVQPNIIRKLRETRLFAQVGATVSTRPALEIRGKFMDYDPGSSTARAVGFGSNPSLTAQIEIVDVETNRVLGIAMVSGSIKSVVRANPEELSDGVAKAVRGLLVSHMERKPPKER
jgi:hypothetical protein